MSDLINTFSPGPAAVQLLSYLPIGDAIRFAETCTACNETVLRCLTRLEFQRPPPANALRTLLRRNPPLSHVTIPDLECQDVLDAIPLDHVTHLCLPGCWLRDLSCLSRCRSLQCLDLSGADVTDLSAISGCTLTELSLSGTSVTCLAVIQSSIPTLQSLDLSGTQIKDLHLLCHAFRLRNLSLVGCHLQHMTFTLPDNVTCADLTSTSLRDLLFLPTSLEELTLAYSRGCDLAGLKRFTRLTYMDLRGVHITDLGFVRSLPRIQFLDISRTNISDLYPLRYSVMLRGVRAQYTAVQDLTPVSYCPNLEMLDVSYTKVRDLSPISRCSKLFQVNVVDTDAADSGRFPASVIRSAGQFLQLAEPRHDYVTKRSTAFSVSAWTAVFFAAWFALQSI